MKNITKHKKVESEFENSNKLLQITLDAMSESVFLIDSDHKILQCNKATLDILGKSTCREIIGHSCWELLHCTSGQVDWCPVKCMRQSGQREAAVQMINDKWFKISVDPVFNDEGEITGAVHVITDISAQKKTEDALSESEQQYVTILNSLGDAMHVVDKDLRFIFQNPAMIQWLEKLNMNSDIIDKNLFEAFPFLNYDKVYNEYLKVFKTGELLTTTEITQLFGRLIFTETMKIPVKSEGSVNQIITIMRDITVQKEAEQKLKESEERYRLITENANDMIAILNNKIEYEYVNDAAFHNIMGRTKDALIGGNALRWVHPDDLDKCLNAFEQGWEKGESNIQARFKDTNNEYHWLDVRGKKIYDQKGEEKVLIVSRDISDRREYEQKLKVSEEKYRSLIENSLEGVWAIDSNANSTLVNPRMANILGYSVEEMIGNSLFSYMDEDQVKITELHLEKRKKGISEERDAVFIHKNGNKVYLRIRATPIFDIEGNYEGTYAFLADVTQRIITEQKLKESEEKYRLISENTDDLIAVYSENGIVEYLNAETHSRVLGYTPEEFLNKSFRDALVHKDNRELADQFGIEGLKKGNFVYQFRLKHQNGNYLWFEVTGKKFVDNYGNNKILCVSRNINEKRTAENKIKESEENFRTIAEQAFIGTLIIQDDKVEYVNTALLQIIDYSHEEIDKWKKNDLIKLIHPEDLQYLKEYRQKSRDGESDIKPYSSYRVFTKYGKIKWIDQFSRPIIYRGKTAELITIMDITEKKKAEQELIKLNSLKSELLRRTSHELKTPLVSIKGFSDLLLTVHKEKLDDYVLATIHEIKLGCERLESLIQDILKSSELESESVELKKSQEDLSFLIKLCMKELQGLIRLRNHEIILEIHDKLITSFEPDQIHLVISNLLNNAIKYTPPNGIIEIKSAIMDDFILISIHDNGIGITYEEKKRLFSQFGKIERYGQGLDIISDGSGLGLFISKKIIELHGGKISVKSRGRNKGSTFSFALPLIIEDQE